MVQQLLRNILSLIALITLSAVCWIQFHICPIELYKIAYLILMPLCVYFAYRTYKKTRVIAKAIDDNLLSIHRQLGNYLLLFKIIFNGEESESKSKAKEQTENEVQPRTDRDDESEDHCASPI